MKKSKLPIDGNSLTLDHIESFLHQNPTVQLTQEAKKKIKKSRALIEKWIDEDAVIYGVTTGFGMFANVKISTEELEKLQENLITSHSAGVGEPLPPFIVKIMMLLRLNTLAKGNSGIRLETLELLMAMINNNIIPVIPSQGSVGSSGDLAPLSHLVLAMIGKGYVQVIPGLGSEDKPYPKPQKAASALKKAGLEPIRLGAKEGLALINGTQMMTAFASYICVRARKLAKLADAAAGMSHEAWRATDAAFDKRVHELRPYNGQQTCAANILKLIANSEIRESHKDVEIDPRVQDPYSLRCIPQVHGASRDAIDYVCSRVEIELNSVTDNPLIFPEDNHFISAGNFHGQPMALAMDFMKIALAELANISERRTDKLTNGSSEVLPRFLIKKGGLNSGFMISQYTAAALVSENKTLAHPASVDSIPTSAGQEDINSMGSIASRHCYLILRNLENVLAIELLTACQAVEFLKPLKCGKGTSKIYDLVRKHVKPMDKDREMHIMIEGVAKLVRNDEILQEVEKAVKLS